METNYSLFSLPITVLLAYWPHVHKGYLVIKQTGDWNNSSPRENVGKSEQKMTRSAYQKAKRCEAAHQNGIEAFPIFAISVVRIKIIIITIIYLLEMLYKNE